MTKRFSNPPDVTLVGDLMEQLVVRFGEDWDAQVRRQKSMAARARDLLLTWGRFSPQYLARAYFDEARTAAEVGWGLARLACLACLACRTVERARASTPDEA